MANEVDTGDSYFAYPLWRGKYSIKPEESVSVDNSTLMLTKTNDVQICGDFKLTTSEYGEQKIATLPEDCIPSQTVILPIFVLHKGQNSDYPVSTWVKFETTGAVVVYMLAESDVETTVYLHGVSYHLCGKWYTNN